MTRLHDYLNNRNLHAFRGLLQSSTVGGNSGTGKSSSWGRSNPLAFHSWNVNSYDDRGRAVLHIACTIRDGLEYVKLLLRHPAINVNLPDVESQWTPLHRALYNGNIPVALLLLQRHDTDSMLQDNDGHTAFDLYSSTLENFTRVQSDASDTELYTWGINRNATLGLGDADDRTFPEQVVLERRDNRNEKDERLENISRFTPIYFRQIQMSKLHTAVVTTERKGNLRLCGFGSGGRLGAAQHMQYKFEALPHFDYTIVSVALGQDHTLALTEGGEVLSWGLNRFSQLGYVFDLSSAGEHYGEPIQLTPKKVGALKKVFVKGVAASKNASACWTDTDMYTWGTNNGQLGYPKTSDPQILPRIVSWVTQPVLSISLEETMMACLLVSRNIICICNDNLLKINFPVHGFPTEIQPHRPRASQDQTNKVAKIASCDNTFAALTMKGDLFTFSALNYNGASEKSGHKRKMENQPKRVATLTKGFGTIKDVALGSNGSIIFCTDSGHTFSRTPAPQIGQSLSSRSSRFQRLIQFQRVIKVYANSTGSFAALRAEFKPKAIEINGNTFKDDLGSIQSYLRITLPFTGSHQRYLPDDSFQHHEDEEENSNMECYIFKLRVLFDILETLVNHGCFPKLAFCVNYGADVILHLSSQIAFACHKVILAARSQPLCALLTGSVVLEDKRWAIILRQMDIDTNRGYHRIHHLSLEGCQPISALILLTFLYTDEVLAIWDRRMATALEDKLKIFNINPSQVQEDLVALAEILGLSTLAHSLSYPSRRDPNPSLSFNMRELFHTTQVSGGQNTYPGVLAPDVILNLNDRDVFCHSVILRARSAFFANFFAEEDWTIKRQTGGILAIDMRHLEWRVMGHVLSYMCYGAEDLFDSLDFANSVDQVLEFFFDVMAVANELLLDRLILLCSQAVLKHLNLQNACYILSEASHFFAEQLVDRVHSFLVANLELFLESGLLDDVPLRLTTRLAQYIQEKQEQRWPVTRLNRPFEGSIGTDADETSSDYFCPPRTPSPREESFTIVESPRKIQTQNFETCRTSKVQEVRSKGRQFSNDCMFDMDDPDTANFPSSLMRQNIVSASVWKPTVTPKVDMKFVMAEEAKASPMGPPRQKVNNSSLVSEEGSQKTLAKNPESTNIIMTNAPSSTRPQPTLGCSAKDVIINIPIASRSTSAQSSSSAKKPIFGTGGPTHSAPGLGPTFFPARQITPSPESSSSPTIRRVSGKAWSNPTTGLNSLLPTTGMSLVAIQQLELEKIADGANKEKRSLLEIQEEEKARQQEESFLAWWTAEEERIRSENEITAMSTMPRKSSPRKHVDHPRHTRRVIRKSDKSTKPDF